MRRLVFVLPLLLACPIQAAEFSVDTTVDAVDASPGDGICGDAGGACTLRAAVMEANALAGEDEISLPAGHYLLDIAGSREDAGETGDLDVTGALRIVGAGAPQTVLEAAPGIEGVLQTFDRLAVTKLTIHRPLGVALSGGQGSELEVTGSAIMGDIWIWDAGAVRIVESTINGGGSFGLLLAGGTGAVINSTVSGGHVRYGCGKCGCLGVPLISLQGGSSLSLVDSTLAFDDIDAECLPWYGIWGNGSLTLSGTVIEEGSCDLPSITSYGHNVASDGTCNLTDPTDLPNTDPMLGPLQHNGGPTATHALLPGSPAIDAIPPQNCTWDDDGDPGTPPVPLATDQRGTARPQGAGCDIGAFEAVPEPKELAGWAAAFAALMLVRHIRGRSARSAAG
jgi:CSLREA domain-containing protein